MEPDNIVIFKFSKFGFSTKTIGHSSAICVLVTFTITQQTLTVKTWDDL